MLNQALGGGWAEGMIPYVLDPLGGDSWWEWDECAMFGGMNHTHHIYRCLAWVLS